MSEPRFNNNGKWDFELEPKAINGKIWEQLSAYLFLDDKVSFEVKSEGKHKWGLTGNVYIEFQQIKNGKWVDSGISITESDFWIFVLKDYDMTKAEHIIITPTYKLKKRIKRLLKKGKILIDGKPKTDDGEATKGYIVPIQYLFLYETEYEEDRTEYVKGILKNKK